MDILVYRDNQYWKIFNDYQLFNANDGFTIQLAIGKQISVFSKQKEVLQLTRDSWELGDFINDKDGVQWEVTHDEILMLVNTLELSMKNVEEYTNGLYELLALANTQQDVEAIVFNQPSFQLVVGVADEFNYYTKDEMDLLLDAKITSLGEGTNITIDDTDPMNPVISTIAEVSQLNLGTEGSNTGWWLEGDNRDNKGTIGSNAIDLSFSLGASITRGATGEKSFATGNGTIASAINSHAEGDSSVASGAASHAEGFVTIASGQYSHAEGESTTASGIASHAEGDDTIASGTASHVEGSNTVARTVASHAEGYFNSILNDAPTGAHVEGKYAIDVTANQQHVVGIGIDNSNRANGFVVETTGKVLAPSLTTVILGAESSTSKCLITKEYADANYSTLDEAPIDGRVYGRTDATWKEVDVYYQTHEKGKNDLTDPLVSGTWFKFLDSYTTECGPFQFYIVCMSGTGNTDPIAVLEVKAIGMEGDGTKTSFIMTAKSQDKPGIIHVCNRGRNNGQEFFFKFDNDALFMSTDHVIVIGAKTSKLLADITPYINIVVDDADVGHGSGRDVSAEFFADWQVYHYLDGRTNGLDPVSAQDFVTKSYGDANYIGNLVYDTEGANTGYWLISDDRINKGNIGNNAIDLSVADNDVEIYGATGNSSHATGINTLASGESSNAEGWNTIASGQYSHAEGNNTVAQNIASHAEGSTTIASGTASHSEGTSTIAIGINSHVEGNITKAIGDNSHAQGWKSIAAGEFSHAEGAWTTTGSVLIVYDSSVVGTLLINGDQTSFLDITKDLKVLLTNEQTIQTISATDFVSATHLSSITTISYTGNNNLLNNVSHVLGNASEHYGRASHAEGNGTIASGAFSHAEGMITKATGSSSHAEGQGTLASGAFGSHAEGGNTIASGSCSHAEGNFSEAIGMNSHAEGNNTVARAGSSHAEGSGTVANSPCSHAEGVDTFADWWGAHSEGWYTSASGTSSHAEGDNTTSAGYFSHAEGYETKTGDVFKVVSADITGELYLAGDQREFFDILRGIEVYLGALKTIQYIPPEDIVSIEYVSPNTIITYSNNSELKDHTSLVFGNRYGNNRWGSTFNRGWASHVEGNYSKASGAVSHAEGDFTSAEGDSSHAEGFETIARGYKSHAEGNKTKTGNIFTLNGNNSVVGEFSIPGNQTGVFSISNDIKVLLKTENKTHSIFSDDLTSITYNGSNTTIIFTNNNFIVNNVELVYGNLLDGGEGAHAEGYQTTANGVASHAEGSGTIANGPVAHAEGFQTIASGSQSHAEGYQTKASGVNSHAQGNFTTASGENSFAHGNFTTAGGNNSTAMGSGSKTSGNNSLSSGSNNTSLLEDDTTIGRFNIASNQVLLVDRVEVISGPEVIVYIKGDYTSNIDFSTRESIDVVLINDDINTTFPYAGTVPFPLTQACTYDIVEDETLVYTFSAPPGNSIFGVVPHTIKFDFMTETFPSSAIAIGMENIAGNAYAMATGQRTKAYGKASFAGGFGTESSGTSSHAEGHLTIAGGASSHAEGSTTIASGDNSHAEGNGSQALGTNSHAGGSYTRAKGNNSMAFGSGSKAVGDSSVSIGSNNTSFSNDDSTIGRFNIASNQVLQVDRVEVISGPYVIVYIKGDYTAHIDYTTRQDVDVIFINDDINTTFPYTGTFQVPLTQACIYDIIEDETLVYTLSSPPGTSIIGVVPHNIVFNPITDTFPAASISIGMENIAGNAYAMATGQRTKAYGKASFAGGFGTESSGTSSHAEGHLTIAGGASSHAEGIGNEILSTAPEGAHVEGKYANLVDTNKISVIGIGSDYATRIDGRVMWMDGTMELPVATNELITSRGNQAVTTKKYVDDQIGLAITTGMNYKGGYDAALDTPSLDGVTPITGIKIGDTYTVTTGGLFFDQTVETGDTLIARQDSPTTVNHWVIAQANMTPQSILAALLTVDGASSGLDADLLDGQHGSYYLPTSVVIDEDNMISNSDTKVPTQQSVKAYVDGKVPPIVTFTTSTTTANQIADTNSSTTYRTIKYIVSITSGTAYQSCELLVCHDGTTAKVTEYANIYTGSTLSLFDADILSGSIRLLVTPVNATTTYKILKTMIEV